MTRAEIERCLDRYVDGLASGDMSQVAIDDEISFRGPHAGEVSGEAAVRALLNDAARAFKDLTLHRGDRIIDGDQAVEIFDVELADGTLVSFADHFEFSDGKITRLHAIFDTRPIVSALAPEAADQEG